MLYFFDVFGPSQGLVDRDKVPVSVFDLAQLLDELVGPVIVCQRARVFWTIVMVIVSRMLLSGFLVSSLLSSLCRVFSLIIAVVLWN